MLEAGEASAPVLAAIRVLNAGVEVEDRGAYLRVLVPERCVVTRAAIEAASGQAFVLPGDLERVMPSFKGRFAVSADHAEWTL